MDITSILEELQKAKGPEPVVEDGNKDLGEFSFTEEKDPQGVLKGHPSYVKRSCNSCYGRGFAIQTSYGPRRYIHCGCVLRGYERARKRFEREMAWARKAYPKATDEEIKDIALGSYLS